MPDSRPPPAANPLAGGEEARRAPEPCTLVLFGATGDLTARKLVPALFNLDRNGLLPSKVAIVGVARRPVGDEGFRDAMRIALEPLLNDAADRSHAERFIESLFYHATSFDDAEGFRGLAERLRAIERTKGLPGHRLFYLATSPSYFVPIVEQLAGVGLTAEGEGWSRVIVEKPIGHDLASARELNDSLLLHLAESQIFRIDHYLGKETVQNLLALRFANGIFEPLWNQKYVEHVQITVAESLGVEGRGGYYDRSGALRDMVQNHLLQVLSLVAMEPPAALEADAIRNEKVKVLSALRRMDRDLIDRDVVRGQYAAGGLLGEMVSGYLDETGVPGGSKTETYVALRLFIDNWRWAGVPFLLRSAKRLPKRATEVYIQFRRPPLTLFRETSVHAVTPNALIVNVQPNEGISLRFGAKVPGPDIVIQQVKMDFRYGSSFASASPEAYERLLLDALNGDSTLFTRRDEVEAQWSFIQDILDGWRLNDAAPEPYEAGTWGPAAAERLVEGSIKEWRRL